jgi:hypothetical protein
MISNHSGASGQTDRGIRRAHRAVREERRRTSDEAAVDSSAGAATGRNRATREAAAETVETRLHEPRTARTPAPMPAYASCHNLRGSRMSMPKVRTVSRGDQLGATQRNNLISSETKRGVTILVPDRSRRDRQRHARQNDVPPPNLNSCTVSYLPLVSGTA